MSKFDKIMKEIEDENPRFHDRVPARKATIYNDVVFKDKRMQSPLTQLMFADLQPKKYTIMGRIKRFIGRVKSAYHYFKYET